jgi:hypothetical protein
MTLFQSRTVTALIVVGLVTFLLGLLLTAFAGDIFGEISPGHDSYSRSLVGHHALLEFLRQSGKPVLVNRIPGFQESTGSFSLLLLEPLPWKPDPTAFIEEEAGDPLGRIMDGAGDMDVVVALPKREIKPSYRQRGWIRSESLLPLEEVSAVLHRALQGGLTPGLVRAPAVHGVSAEALGMGEAEVVVTGEVQLIEPCALFEPLVTCDEGVLIGCFRTLFWGVRFYVISDPDLFNNRGLARGDHAALIHALLEKTEAEGVVVDETLHGYRPRGSLLARAFSFPLVLLTIHGFLALGLLAWSGARRFGRTLAPPPEVPPGKKLLIDNTAKLLLTRGDHGDAARRYLQVTVADLSRSFHLEEGTSKRDPLPGLKRLTEIRGANVDVNVIEHMARKKTLTARGALHLARRIHHWRLELKNPSREE